MSDLAAQESTISVVKSPAESVAARLLGVRTYLQSSTEIVNKTVYPTIKHNPNRIALMVVNNSDATVYINNTNKVSSTFSIILTPNGGSMSMGIRDDGESVTSEFYTTASTDDNPITVVETLISEVVE